jgi:NAD(P)-dependent dehydrogenase (short-subunit alcohol dehydrogenase family)
MLSYEGKRVLVVGGATGMGAATAKRAKEAGAKVIVLDIAQVDFPVDEFIQIDLRDKSSVDAVVGRLDRPLDAVFSCAGVADGTRGIMVINFIAQRRLLEGLIAKEALPRGSAIGMISSTAGNGWRTNIAQVQEFLAIRDWDQQVAWIDAHKSDDYMSNADGYRFSKEAMCGYVSQSATELLKRGIRINSILPGPTDTPLARANADIWLAYATDYRNAVGVKHLTPDEMAYPLLYLCSPLASGITGENLVVDQGYTMATVTGSFKG